MGWYDSLGGKTERVNIQNVTGGSAAKNFGDAFASIGKVIIDNEVAKDRAKLTDLQVQNEQNKLDEFKDAKKQKKFDDAFSLDIKTLDPSVSSEATQNAVDALKSFHTPSAPAVALQEQETKAKATEFQINQDKKYLGDAWTLDATASKDSRQNATDALGEFYKPDISAKDKVVEHFKGLDNIAQVKFNDEAIEQSVSGGYKNMKEFTVAHPELVKNADGVTMAKIESFYGGKDKDAQAKADSDRTYGLQVSKFNHDVSNDNKTLALQAQKSSGGKDTLPREEFEYQKTQDEIKAIQSRTKEVETVIGELPAFKELPKSDQIMFKKEYIKNGYIPAIREDGRQKIYELPPSDSTKTSQSKKTNRPSLSEL